MGQNLVILGGGESGIGTALLGKSKGYDVFLSDQGSLKDTYRQTLVDCNIAFEEGTHTTSTIFKANLVVKSPGIPNKAALIQELREKKIPIISEIEFASKFYKGNIIAITGSNGKTTTTGLVYHVLQKAGLDALIGGNIGKSFAGQIIDRQAEHAVLEVSSFQLDDIESFKPHIAILLNITPDHLDRYEYDLSKYAASKLSISSNQDENDYLIYNYDDPITNQYLDKSKIKAKLIPISIEQELEEGAWLSDNEIKIQINKTGLNMSIQKLALQGKHNIYNSMAAGVAGRILELRKEIIRESLSDFQNIEHRLEFVTTVCGVKYINDSKATNINSTWYALESMDAPTVWIVGGVDKGNDYDMLKNLVTEKVKAIVCLGVDNSKIHAAFDGLIETVIDAQSMREAVGYAYKLSQKGDSVLLSPACASFDLFENYEERGRQFKEAARGL